MDHQSNDAELTPEALSNREYYSDDVMAAIGLNRAKLDNYRTRTRPVLAFDTSKKSAQKRIYTLKDIYRLAVLKWLVVLTGDSNCSAYGINKLFEREDIDSTLFYRSDDKPYYLTVEDVVTSVETGRKTIGFSLHPGKINGVQAWLNNWPVTRIMNLTRVLANIDANLIDMIQKEEADL